MLPKIPYSKLLGCCTGYPFSWPCESVLAIVEFDRRLPLAPKRLSYLTVKQDKADHSKHRQNARQKPCLRVPEKRHEVRMKSKGEQVNPSKGAKNGNALSNGNIASVQEIQALIREKSR